MSKVYKLQSGKPYQISQFPQPAKNGIVFFTSAEFDYLKAHRLSQPFLELLWESKLKDHNHPIIPESEKTEAERLSKTIGQEIIDSLRSPNVEKEVPEIQEPEGN